MVELERTAKLILLNGALGEPQALSAAEIQQFKSTGGLRARGKADPAIASFMEWSYYESLIKRGNTGAGSDRRREAGNRVGVRNAEQNPSDELHD